MSSSKLLLATLMLLALHAGCAGETEVKGRDSYNFGDLWTHADRGAGQDAPRSRPEGGSPDLTAPVRIDSPSGPPSADQLVLHDPPPTDPPAGVVATLAYSVSYKTMTESQWVNAHGE